MCEPNAELVPASFVIDAEWKTSTHKDRQLSLMVAPPDHATTVIVRNQLYSANKMQPSVELFRSSKPGGWMTEWLWLIE